MKKLSQQQRITTGILYFIILVIVFWISDENFSKLFINSEGTQNLWFFSGAFLIILGAYLVEPFFTKPSDVIVNSIAIFIALIGLSNKNTLTGYTFIFWYSIRHI